LPECLTPKIQDMPAPLVDGKNEWIGAMLSLLFRKGTQRDPIDGLYC